METKPASQSKYIWFNAIGGLLTAFEGFTGAIQTLIPVPVYLAMLGISIFGNLVLRFYTDKAIAK